MSNPIRLTDDELSAVMLACQPLAPEARDGFLQAVAASLQTCGEVGPGSVHRAIVVAQREFFDPARVLARGRQLKISVRKKVENPIISKRGRDYDLARLKSRWACRCRSTCGLPARRFSVWYRKPHRV